MRASYVGAETLLFHNGARARARRAVAASSRERLGLQLDRTARRGCGHARYSWMGGDLLMDYEPILGNYSSARRR